MDKIVVLDFGGQYAHLIANRIRRLGVYSEITDCSTPATMLGDYNGIILSGGPGSVLEAGSPSCDPRILDLGIPVLGLCYGHQLVAKMLGGTVSRGDVREYGIAEIEIGDGGGVFAGLESRQQVWMSHGDAVSQLPPSYKILASTPDCIAAAVRHETRPLFGFQFHPEVTDTPHGMTMLDNFLSICGCAREWNTERFVQEIKDEVRRRCEGKKVFLLVSGGVDSSVAFALLNEVLGPSRVMGLHIDNGLMRLNESAGIMRYLREHGFDNLRIVDASEQFLAELSGVVEPEKKREKIGRTFITVQAAVLGSLGLNADEWLLGQGTIYPDTIESAGTAHSDRIKTHHNRVDIILELMEKGLVVEPVSQLYKDEVRMLGEALGLPRHLVWRHPFPGPGLGVRTLCSHGKDEPVAREVQVAVETRAGTAGYEAVVLPVRSVGVQGDGRTYAHPVALVGPRDWKALEQLSTVLTNTIGGVNRVVYALRVQERLQYRSIEAYVTRERLDILRAFDDLVTREVVKHGQYDAIWQMPVVVIPLVNTLEQQCFVLRPIVSREAMTARFVALGDSIIDGILTGAEKIDGVGDIFIDITHKPPGTIEWE